MSENESIVVNRATEILGGQNSWTSDELRDIEKSLSGYGRRELAQRIRALRVEQGVLALRAETDEGRAASILDGLRLSRQESRRIERGLRAGGESVPADRVRAHRMGADRRLAEEFIRGGKLKTEEARELEKSLAKDGHDKALVSDVRGLRYKADTARAVQVLSNAPAGPDEMLELAKSLAQYKEIGYARRVLKRAREEVSEDKYPKLPRKIFQKSALYTYKDPDLPLGWRLDHAHEILRKIESLAETQDKETLGLAGAIFKRKWEADGKRQNLERSLFYYLKGYTQCLPADAPPEAREDVLGYVREKMKDPAWKMDATKDQGWNGLNAAFVLDLLAEQEDAEAKSVGISSEAADVRHGDARLIREELVRSVPSLTRLPDYEWLEDEWWYYATVGEAYFGLGEYKKASEWLVEKSAAAGLRIGFGSRFAAKAVAGLDVPEWEYESTARQLARLALMKCGPGISETEFEEARAGLALKEFLRENDQAVRSTFRGKFGLGLSGGGFRASLFHIGVLARLAELNVLRHVEVLSCVSGGSIVGAHYYLEVRRLLQTKADDAIEQQDYVEIVKRLEERFLRGVQRNIRTRVLAGIYTNLKMIFVSGYSRTLRVGELYERELYSEVEDGDDGKSPVTGPRWLRWLPAWAARLVGLKREKRWLDKLQIQPLKDDGSRDADFRPRDHNWRRKNKAPILVLNTASLNTGHTWQFTTTYMGEPPTPINREIDCNYRLRRMYHRDAPPKYPPVRLGYAVAASSCVPGLFEPLILDDLYPDTTERRISVRLVDGGVCDNQGIASLLEQDCSVLLISDGSGQMETEDIPSSGLLGVPLRSNSILQARVREAQYGDIASRRSSSVLRGMMFVHLKQELAGEALAWRKCPPEMKETDFERESEAKRKGVTSYGVAPDTQLRLAAVRTDLDSFCDAEAHALMSSGYRMTSNQFRGKEPPVEGFDADAPQGEWRFRKIEQALEPRGAKKEQLDRLLDASGSAAFKVWKLWLPLIILKWLMVFAAVGAVGLVAWDFYTRWKSGRGWEESIIPRSVYEWAGSALTYKWVGVTVASAVALALLAFVVNAVVGKMYGKYIMRVIRWRDTLTYIAIGIGMSLAGFAVARLHLHVFDKIYLWYGRAGKFR